jgi:PhzF family phenazine biosynthesis protein
VIEFNPAAEHIFGCNDGRVTAPVLRYTAFSDRPEGGNPAGVVLAAGGMGDAEMLAIAADLGFSETAFLDGEELRYFSPLAEVPFSGHATIATAVALAERDGPGTVRFQTRSGTVPVRTERDGDGRVTATLTRVPPRVADLSAADLDELLAALGWAAGDLDPALPPRVGYAGAHHPVLGAATRERLAALDYDFERLGALMAARDWTTVQLVWRESEDRFHARDPFPPGGVVEDPATGAAAAALGGYLRELGLVQSPARITIRQGEDLGRPSLLGVAIPAEEPGIEVTGTAVAL